MNADQIFEQQVIDLQKQTNRMARLLLECRDALPAISMASARLRGISLSLADRIEEELKPWAVKEGKEGS